MNSMLFRKKQQNGPVDEGPVDHLALKDDCSELTRSTIAQWLYLSRQMRPSSGIEGLYGEPVWDMLLEIYINQKKAKCESVSSICIGAKVPNSTGLRYLSTLEASGWLNRMTDKHDRRRVLVTLSPKGIKQMDDYIDRLARLWPVANRLKGYAFGPPDGMVNDQVEETRPSQSSRAAG